MSEEKKIVIYRAGSNVYAVRKSKRGRPVVADGDVFPSATAVEGATGIATGVVCDKCNNGGGTLADGTVVRWATLSEALTLEGAVHIKSRDKAEPEKRRKSRKSKSKSKSKDTSTIAMDFSGDPPPPTPADALALAAMPAGVVTSKEKRALELLRIAKDIRDPVARTAVAQAAADYL